MDNDIFLNLCIRKSNGKTDEFGNYIFEVEASNENLDLQNQVVLQRALLDSKEFFLKNGIISYNHQHKKVDDDGNVISDPSMIIGEPIDVRADGDSTIVVGKLYKQNKIANELINLLKTGSTRVRASVGGIYPKIEKNDETGVEKVTSVLWNDLALTTAPVNSTVGQAAIKKSLDPCEFVKALSLGGYETDGKLKTNGQALQKEGVKNGVINASSDGSDTFNALASGLRTGEIKGEAQAVVFLKGRGLSEDEARNYIREFLIKGDEMMKKSFTEQISEMLKSLRGNGGKDDGKKKPDSNDGNSNDGGDGKMKDTPNDTEKAVSENKEPVAPDNNNDGNNGGGDVNKGCDGSKDDNVKKSEGNIDWGNLSEGEGILKALKESIEKLNTKMDDVGCAMLEISKGIFLEGNAKIPARSAMQKSVTGNGGGVQTSVQQGRPTEEDLEKAQEVLSKSIQEHKISLVDSSVILNDMRKCMMTGVAMDKENYKTLCKMIKEAR